MIFLLFVGYAVVYIDKTVMGFALLPIEREFNLQPEQLGYITGIFFLAYSLFQIPAGWLNDRFGYKKCSACRCSCWAASRCVSERWASAWDYWSRSGFSPASAIPAILRPAPKR